MNKALFSKASDEWQTPQDFYDALANEFHFDLDCAATEDNAKVFNFISRQADALTCSWRGYIDYQRPVCWLNPPYSQCREFIAKAAEEARKGCTVVCLVPSRTDTRWWHEHIWNAFSHGCRPGVEVRFIKGRLRFVAGATSAPFPSAVVIFRPPDYVIRTTRADTVRIG
jgi:phage N-6-adenine-methyltransferase